MKRLFIAAIFFSLLAAVNFAQDKKEKSPEIQPVPDLPALFDNYYNFGGKKSAEEALSKLDKKTQALLKKIRNYSKQRFNELLFQAQFKSSDLNFNLPDMKKMRNENKQKIWQLELETEALGLEAQNGKENRKAVESKLRSKLEQLFDLKEENRKAEVQSLEEELKQLKKALGFRQKNKEQIVERRLQELTGKSKFYDWDK